MDAVNGDELEGREGINPFDFWTGADFKLRVKKVAGYPNYDSSEFVDPATLEGLEDAQLESIWNRQHKLQPLVAPDQFKSYDQLQDRLNLVLNLKSSGAAQPAAPVGSGTPTQKDVPDVSSKPQFQTRVESRVEEPVSSTPVNKPVVEDADDDVLDYFKKLAEE